MSTQRDRKGHRQLGWLGGQSAGEHTAGGDRPQDGTLRSGEEGAPWGDREKAG